MRGRGGCSDLNHGVFVTIGAINNLRRLSQSLRGRNSRWMSELVIGDRGDGLMFRGRSIMDDFLVADRGIWDGVVHD